MPTTKPRKRVTPRPLPARNFDEARSQIRRYLPKNLRVTVTAYTVDDRCSPGYRHIYETYGCEVSSDAGKILVDLSAKTPAKLVTAFLEWRDAPPKREAPPFSAEIDLSKRSLAPVPARNEPRSSSGNIGHSVPKLAHSLPLLPYHGGSRHAADQS